jgi:hypothetical protein
MGMYKVIGSGSVYGNLTIGVTATLIKVGANQLAGRHAVFIENPIGSTRPVYIGFDNSVNTSNGIPIEEGDSKIFDLDPNESQALYGIASASTTVRVAEVKSGN